MVLTLIWMVASRAATLGSLSVSTSASSTSYILNKYLKNKIKITINNNLKKKKKNTNQLKTFENKQNSKTNF